MKHYNDYLAHYGIPGMKWGVRNEKERAQRRAINKDYRAAKRSKLGNQLAVGADVFRPSTYFTKKGQQRFRKHNIGYMSANSRVRKAGIAKYGSEEKYKKIHTAKTVAANAAGIAALAALYHTPKSGSYIRTGAEYAGKILKKTRKY